MIAPTKQPLLGYGCWQSMKSRCYTPKRKDWCYYGGAGITVCERWLESFDNFITDMGPRPSLKHTISRYGDVGNYEPGNCEWSNKNYKKHSAEHGTPYKYKKGCRCDLCRKAKQQYNKTLPKKSRIEYLRKWRAKNTEKIQAYNRKYYQKGTTS